MPKENWRLLNSRTVGEHHIFSLRYDRYQLRRPGCDDAPEQDFVVLDFVDWVNVVAVTPDRKVVFVRQFRHGVREDSLELPGGMLDAGEDPAAAALRELAEETGYESESVAPLGSVWPNPAIQNNRCHFFAAWNVEASAATAWDEFEQMETVLVPLDDLPKMLSAGEIGHTLVISALAMLGVTVAGVHLRSDIGRA